jgi:hypothetical protein
MPATVLDPPSPGLPSEHHAGGSRTSRGRSLDLGVEVTCEWVADVRQGRQVQHPLRELKTRAQQPGERGGGAEDKSGRRDHQDEARTTTTWEPSHRRPRTAARRCVVGRSLWGCLRRGDWSDATSWDGRFQRPGSSFRARPPVRGGRCRAGLTRRSVARQASAPPAVDMDPESPLRGQVPQLSCVLGPEVHAAVAVTVVRVHHQP